jgi:hypothetical protein
VITILVAFLVTLEMMPFNGFQISKYYEISLFLLLLFNDILNMFIYFETCFLFPETSNQIWFQVSILAHPTSQSLLFNILDKK